MNPDTGEIRHAEYTTPEEKQREHEKLRAQGFTVPLEQDEASELEKLPRKERRKRLAEMRKENKRARKEKRKRGL